MKRIESWKLQSLERKKSSSRGHSSQDGIRLSAVQSRYQSQMQKAVILLIFFHAHFLSVLFA